MKSQRDKAKKALGKGCGFGKPAKMATGGAAKIRKGVSSPAGKPISPRIPSAKENFVPKKAKSK